MKTEAQFYREETFAWHKVKLVVAILTGIYFLWAAIHPEQWRLIDGVNLVMHEAGHLIFRPMGEFLMILGGSLFQVIVPATFAGYFYRTHKEFSCALVLFWVGESLLNVSVYAADSVSMQLPLLGGENSIHDWNYMLDHLGMLRQTGSIALVIRVLGTLIIIYALVWAIFAALRSSVKQLKNY